MNMTSKNSEFEGPPSFPRRDESRVVLEMGERRPDFSEHHEQAFREAFIRTLKNEVQGALTTFRLFYDIGKTANDEHSPLAQPELRRNENSVR